MISPRLLVCALALLGAAPGCAQPAATAPQTAIASQTVFQTDFADSTKAVERTSPEGQSIKGVLPPDWNDNSAYQKDAVIGYQLAEVAGKKGLRVTKTAGKTVALTHALPPQFLVANATYRLTIEARNPDAMQLNWAVRDAGAPYKTHWSADANLGDEWQTWTTDFKLPPIEAGRAVAFYLFASGDGSFDLGRVTLEARSRAALMADVKAKYPDGGPTNLLRQTRFPLGLQSGWAIGSLHSLNDDVSIEPDAQTRGPSGAPSLQVKPLPGNVRIGKPVVLWSAPFDIARPDETHTASFYISGDGQGSLGVARDYGNIEGQTEWQVRPADGWKRVEVAFTPQLGGRAWALKWQIEGDVRLDALQVGPGERAAPYAPQLPLEVALQVGAGDAALAQVHFADEKPTVRYAVSGEVPRGARLVASVFDAWGKERKLTPLELAGKNSEGNLDYAAPAKLGEFRVETRVEDANGKALSAWNEAVVMRVRRPRFWGRNAPASPFGTHVKSTRQNTLLAKAAGFNWTRLHDADNVAKWFSLEPAPGQWQWRDSEIERLKRANLEILPVLQGVPKWASVGQMGDERYYNQNFLPENIADWRNYAAKLATHYKDEFRVFDVWNEPWNYRRLNVGRVQKNGILDYVRPDDEIGAYLKLQRGAHDQLEKTAPDAKVLIDVSKPEWARETFAREKKEGLLADILAFHLYPGGNLAQPGDAVQGEIGEIRRLEREAGLAPRPLWMGEGSPVNDSLFSGFYRRTLLYQSAENVTANADQVARYVVSLLAGGAQKMFLYSLGQQEHFGKERVRWAFGTMEDGAPHPSLAAFSNAAYLLEGARFVASRQFAPGVTAWVFEAPAQGQNPARSIAVLASSATAALVEVPQIAGASALDLFGNPLSANAKIERTLIYLSAPGTGQALLEKLAGK